MVTENKKIYTNIQADKGLDERDLKPQFIDAFLTKAEQVAPKLAKLCIQDTVSDREWERYDYTFNSPLPKRFNGETKYHDLQFNSIKVTVGHFKDGIKWTVNDELKYLGSKSIQDTAKKHGDRYALIPLLMCEYAILESTNAEYMPTALTAYDGDSLICASSDTRFGFATGNYFAGTGVTTEDGVEDDIISAIMQFNKLLDVDGVRPFWGDYDDASNYTLIYGPATAKIINRVFLRNVQAINAGSGATVGTATSQSSILSVGGFNITLMYMAGISGNSYYIVKEDSIRKPFILLHGNYNVPKFFSYGIGQGYKEMDDTLSKAVSFYDAWGLGIHTPQSIIKIYNA